MASLHDHPFGVEAFFRRSSVLTFAAPADTLAPLLPPPFSLDLHDGRWAFLAVAMVQTEALRPAGFPAWMGRSFFLIGYWLFVRYTDARGRRLRGLYILRSETDSRTMKFLGAIWTRYRYHHTSVQNDGSGDGLLQVRTSSGLDVAFEAADDTPLPAGSPFQSWREARRFAGPLPFTFSYRASDRSVLIVEGMRENWEPRPLRIIRQQVPMTAGLQPASAFTVTNIPYHWKKGRRESWTG